jgi:hypothetical protein
LSPLTVIVDGAACASLAIVIPVWLLKLSTLSALLARRAETESATRPQLLIRTARASANPAPRAFHEDEKVELVFMSGSQGAQWRIWPLRKVKSSAIGRSVCATCASSFSSQS